MKNPKRTIHVDSTSMERLKADIQAEDHRFIGEILSSLLTKLALQREKAWKEIMRIAEIDEQTETCELSFITNEILVYDKIKEVK